VRTTGDPDPANNGLHYLYTDHLGSVSAIRQANGAVQQTRYLPFGGYRAGSGPNPITSHAYTSQRENMDIGLYYYNARYYAPYLNRFISADTIVPNREDPQSFNRYVYTRNNPLKYVDADGHCWGAASFVRSWNIDTPWGTIGGGTNCANIDMALAIVQHPDATPAEKAQAGVYLGGWGVAAVSGAAGTGLLACSTAAPCAAAAETVLGLGAAANEISTLTEADLPAVQQFVNDAQTLNSARGFRSFGERWHLMSQTLLQLGRNANMFLARAGDRITGMMRINTDSGVYRIQELEGIGGNAGSDLLTHAFQDSLTRGFDGVYLTPADQAVGFYTRFPGYQILQNDEWFWSAEAIQAFFASQGG
jgi:RHS repeat-associated protein